MLGLVGLVVANDVAAKFYKAAEIDGTALPMGDQPKHGPGPPGNVPVLLIGRFRCETARQFMLHKSLPDLV